MQKLDFLLAVRGVTYNDLGGDETGNDEVPECQACAVHNVRVMYFPEEAVLSEQFVSELDSDVVGEISNADLWAILRRLVVFHLVLNHPIDFLHTRSTSL